MDVMNKVITVSREFGSGGRELGVKLADALGIPFYDKELISMAADDINIAEEAFRRYDEHIVVEDPLDRNFYHAFSDIYQVPMSDQIFVAQSNVIRRMMELEPGSDEKEMERRIREVDRKRKDYYQYYTGNTWGKAQNYHLCVDSGLVGVDGCLRAVTAYLGELCRDLS